MTKTLLTNKKGEVESYFIFEKEKFPATIKDLEKIAKEEKFTGSRNSVFAFRDKNRKIIVCGLGKVKEFKNTYIRNATYSAYQYAKARRAKTISINLPKVKDLENALLAVSEVGVLSTYKFDQFKSKPKNKKDNFEIKEIYVNEKPSKKLNDAIKEGMIKANAQNFVAKTTELPANILHSDEFLRIAKKVAKENNLSITVFDKKKLEKLKMEAILGVNKGSRRPPYMIFIEYNKGKKNLPFYALAGKGIIFDTGGISLKPPRGMHEMKYDETGACVVLGTIMAVAKLKLPIRVLSVMAVTDNKPGENAQVPGDIVRAYNGKTIEVLNTDAEGRLVLSDALSYISKHYKPKGIIDVATLTGAVYVALGSHAIGLMTNNDKFAKVVEEAGYHTHERVWRLPMWEEYSKMVEGTITDVRNIGSERGEAGSITAGAFLKEFVGKGIEWVHLDIAAVDTVRGHRFLGTRASGIGARLLIETLKRLSMKK